jgi:hypothetical protein
VYYNNTIYNIAMQSIYRKESRAIYKNNIVRICGSICFVSDNPATAQITADFNLYDDGASQTKIG